MKDLTTFWTGEEQQRKQVNLFNRDPLFSLTKVTLAFLRQGPSNSKICIGIKSANSSFKSEVTLVLVVNVWFYTGTYLWFLSMYFRGCQKKQILAKKKNNGQKEEELCTMVESVVEFKVLSLMQTSIPYFLNQYLTKFTVVFIW